MAVRSTTAAVVLTAAVAVYALARDRRLRRQLVRERVSYQLVSGCMARDVDHLRRRLNQAMAQQAVLASAGLVVDDVLAARDRTDPPSKGGPR